MEVNLEEIVAFDERTKGIMYCRLYDLKFKALLTTKTQWEQITYKNVAKNLVFLESTELEEFIIINYILQLEGEISFNELYQYYKDIRFWYV